MTNFIIKILVISLPSELILLSLGNSRSKYNLDTAPEIKRNSSISNHGI
jgi:hypothetical protein